MAAGTFNKAWRWATWSGIAFIIIYMLAFLLYLIFNCTPTDAYWKSFDITYTHKYRCVDETVMDVIVGVLSVVTDFYAVMLPAFLFWKLTLPLRQKIGLWLIFGLGLVVVGAGIARTVWLGRLATSWNADATCKPIPLPTSSGNQ